MNMEEIRNFIRTLESEETYFSLIQVRHQVKNITLRESWQSVEDERTALGLNPKHSTYEAYRMARHRYHRGGGEIIRFQDEV
jgi:hypothetical protein